MFGSQQFGDTEFAEAEGAITAKKSVGQGMSGWLIAQIIEEQEAEWDRLQEDELVTSVAIAFLR
jgi:hypothetical protein